MGYDNCPDCGKKLAISDKEIIDELDRQGLAFVAMELDDRKAILRAFRNLLGRIK